MNGAHRAPSNQGPPKAFDPGKHQFRPRPANSAGGGHGGDGGEAAPLVMGPRPATGLPPWQQNTKRQTEQPRTRALKAPRRPINGPFGWQNAWGARVGRKMKTPCVVREREAPTRCAGHRHRTALPQSEPSWCQPDERGAREASTSCCSVAPSASERAGRRAPKHSGRLGSQTTPAARREQE